MIYFHTQTRLSPRIVGTASFLLLFLATVSLHAGQITAINWFSGIGSVAGEIIGPLVAPNNDDAVGPSPNQLLVTQKNYIGIGPVDLEFTVVPTGGVTEYVMNEGVANNTGLPWTGYRLELGHGVMSSFVISPSGDNLDFDAPSFNSGTTFATFFPIWIETEDVIQAAGGIFPNGGFSLPLFRFSVDVPDGITSFTIRQIPIAAIPEPSAALLVAIAAASACFAKRQNRASRPSP